MKQLGLIFLTTISISVSGQNHFIGTKSGVSWTNINSDNFSRGSDPRIGFSGGLSYELFLKKHFSLGADIIYNQRGFSNTINFTDNNGNATGEKSTDKFNYDYLSIPVKTGFTFGKNIYGFTNMGAIPSILVDARTIIPVVNSSGRTTGTQTFDVTSNVSKIDLGVLMEAGGGYKFNKYWLFTSVTYQQSITTISNSSYFSDTRMRHKGLTLSLGLKYRLKKE